MYSNEDRIKPGYLSPGTVLTAVFSSGSVNVDRFYRRRVISRCECNNNTTGPYRGAGNRGRLCLVGFLMQWKYRQRKSGADQGSGLFLELIGVYGTACRPPIPAFAKGRTHFKPPCEQASFSPVFNSYRSIAPVSINLSSICLYPHTHTRRKSNFPALK